jgi:Zn finger protein HypA/HybF involved in hydrogenase expression
MHDLLFAQDIFNQAIATAKQNGAGKIKSITIEIGQIDHHGQLLEPSHLKFHLKNLFDKTIHKNLKIKFKKTKGNKVVLREIEI